MQLAGSRSWRIDVSDSQLLDHAMFVRDVVRLPVPPSPEVPPPTGIATSDRTDVLSDADRPRAGQQWLWWWRRLVAYELTQRSLRDPGEDIRTRMQRRLVEHQRTFDPPAFDTLQRWPELRAATTATVDDARERQRTVNRPARAHKEHFDWTLNRDVAEAVITDYGVRPDQINALVLMIDAPTAWFHLPSPGVVICSTGLTTDHPAARAMLRQTVVSGLTGK
jgi:hypothetical protein